MDHQDDSNSASDDAYQGLDPQFGPDRLVFHSLAQSNIASPDEAEWMSNRAGSPDTQASPLTYPTSPNPFDDPPMLESYIYSLTSDEPIPITNPRHGRHFFRPSHSSPLTLWPSRARIRKHIPNLAYLDLDEKILHRRDSPREEQRFEPRTAAGDLHADLEGMEVWEEGGYASSEYSDEEEGESVDPATSKTGSPSPFAEYFSNSSPSPTLTNPPLEHTNEATETTTSSSPSSQASSSLSLILASLHMPPTTPLSLLERYLLRNPTVVWHAASSTVPLPTTSPSSLLQLSLVPGSTAAAYSAELHEAFRGVAWRDAVLRDVLGVAAREGTRLAGIRWARGKREEWARAEAEERGGVLGPLLS